MLLGLLGLGVKGVIVGGAAMGGFAGIKIKDANKSIKNSKIAVENLDKEYKELEKSAETSLIKLGNTKVEIWKDFDRFINAFKKIKNPPELSPHNSNNYNLKKLELTEIENISLAADKFLIGGAMAGAAGIAAAFGVAKAVAGLAAVGGAGGIPIAALHGIAAQNAMLAWLGGGALAAGGGGMAAGAALLGGIAAAPLAAFGGLFLNIKAKESKEKAAEIKFQVEQITKHYKQLFNILEELKIISDELNDELNEVHSIYIEEVIKLEYIVENNNIYDNFSLTDKKILDNNIKLVALLKDLTDIHLLLKNNDKEEGQIDKVNNLEIQQAIKASEYQRQFI